jgi:signal transduction histidine kinase
VDRLVRALLRRTGQGEANSPEWLHLHDLIRQELDFMLAEGTLPVDLPVDLNLQASRDMLFGVYTDFAEVFGRVIAHALEGHPGQIAIRTWGGNSHFRLELEDDGAPIEPKLLEGAFEPFLDLRPSASEEGRRPGIGLPVCAQLMNAYGGTVQILPAERGSLIRLSLPLE